MANLKFYKMATAPVGTTEKPLEAGAIWFNTTNHTIQVYTGSVWEVYTGLVDASYDATNKQFTIVKHNGEKVELNFSDCASAEALRLLTGRVSTLEGTVATQGGNITDLQGRMTTVEGKAKANEDKLAGLTETTVMAEIAKQVAAEAEIARAAEKALVDRVTPLETASADYAERIGDLETAVGEGGSVATQIEDAIDAFNTDVVTPGLAAKVDNDTYNAYVEANDAAVAAAKKVADDEVIRATAAEAAINEKIGVPADVEGVNAYSKDYTVGMDVKAAKDAAAAAQKTIDDFLTGEGVDPNKVDALKDIIDYMDEHGEDYQAVVDNLGTLNTDVATLKGQMGTGTVDDRIAAAKEDVEGQISAHEEATTEAINGLDERIDALEGLSAGTEITNIKGRLDTLETEVNTNIPQDIADAQAAAEATAAADATSKANTAESNAKGYADGLIAAEVTRSNKYADDAVAVEAAKVAANTAAIAALDAKVTTGLQWVAFE